MHECEKSKSSDSLMSRDMTRKFVFGPEESVFPSEFVHSFWPFPGRLDHMNGLGNCLTWKILSRCVLGFFPFH